MMTFEHILAFNLALLAAMASPGPALLAVLHTTLSAGRISGILTGLGLGLVAATWTAAALIGLDIVFKLFPWAYTLSKIVGALYLLYIARSIWKSATDDIGGGAPVKAGTALLRGMLINLLNPKSVLFAAAVLVVIFPSGLSSLEKGFIILNHLLVEWLCYTVLAILIGTRAMSRRYLAAKHYLDRLTALVLGALGVRLLLDVQR
ncbi:LysE family translocator [Coralliovum pocilloporae]|uniref:LysE family translocator n=1 Tax=Coralliovum pocilloporae TaxID=3066369 RepID=UPI0033070EBA